MRSSKTLLIAGLLAAAGVVAGQSAVGAATLGTTTPPHKTVKATEVDSQYVFAPVTLKIKVGTKVTWKNTSDANHTVTFTTGPFKDGKKLDKVLATDDSLSFTFKKVATYKYHCKYHPGMVGKVVVKPAS